MLCAFDGPMPGSRLSTSGGAVLRLTAPSRVLVAAAAGCGSGTRTATRTRTRTRTGGTAGLSAGGVRALRPELRLRDADAGRGLRIRREQEAAVGPGLAALVAAAAVVVAAARLGARPLLVRSLRAEAL